MLSIKAKIQKREFFPVDKKLWEWSLDGYDNKDVLIEIKLFRKNRSSAQNRLYWLYLNLIASETGHIPEDLNKLFKSEFLPVEYKELYGKKIALLTSSKDLDTKEFTEYLNKIEDRTEIPIPSVWLEEYKDIIN